MLITRPAAERGKAHHGWLDARHSFSFGDYLDPAHMGFGPLRVINEDRILPNSGFDTHGHRDMEIITYVLEGALEHRDSTGGHSVIRPGEVQHMSAGRGIRHSEVNPSSGEPTHLLQIWILPDRGGLAPGYTQKHFPIAEQPGRLHLIASPDGRDGSLPIHQDALVWAGRLDVDTRAELALAEGRGAWVQVARGNVVVNGQSLTAGDGLAVREETLLTMAGCEQGEVLVFDLPL